MKLRLCVHLRAKFRVSSIVLTTFRQGVILPPPPQPQNEPLESPLRLELNTLLNYCDDDLVYSFSTNNKILSLTVEVLESTKLFDKPLF